MSELNYFLNSLHNNIYLPPISSFELRDKCLEDEEKVPIFDWKGTYSGCFCDNKIEKSDFCEDSCINIYSS